MTCSDYQPAAASEKKSLPLEDSKLLCQLFTHFGGIPTLGRVKELETAPPRRHHPLLIWRTPMSCWVSMEMAGRG